MIQAVPYFYEQAGQRLQAWIAFPPKIKHTDLALSDECEEVIAAKEQKTVLSFLNDL